MISARLIKIRNIVKKGEKMKSIAKRLSGDNNKNLYIDRFNGVDSSIGGYWEKVYASKEYKNN